jgi:AICAR transformylase/IMP cyclohydrolase PurH
MRDEFSIKTALISVYDKNGLEDLKKAIWYINDEIKRREKEIDQQEE